MVIGVFVIYTQFQVQEKSRQAETREVLEVIERSFQYGIREVNSIALLLSESVNENGNVVDFNKSATELIERYPLANVLELISNGIVTHVYPLEGYEEILRYDLYQNERIKLELYKAAENNDIYFSGPINLIEGELGIIGLLPFDQDGEDLKISAVIVYLNTFLDQTELSTFSDRYYFELSRKNLETGVEEFFLKPEHDHQIDWSQEQFLMIPEGDWKLYAHQITTTHFPLYIIFLSLFTIIISISIGYLSFKQFQRPIELEALLHERTQELYESKEQFKTSSELLGSVLASPQNIIIYSLDKDFNYIAFNKNYKIQIRKFFGAKVKQGKSVFDIYPNSMIPKIREHLAQTLKGESFEKIQEVMGSDNKITYWENWYSPINDKEGSIIGVTVFSVNITERVKSEKEKTTLLTEIHHRVKNNLAIVSGLLQLQKSETNDERLTAIFDQSINRIISIALVHELMYNNDDLSSVDVHAYLKKLIPAISDTMQNQSQNVQFRLDIEEYDLNINEAIPLGLLLNELITNSFKYAFNGSVNNSIDVILNANDDQIHVTYQENGKGYPQEKFSNPSSLGLNLVHAQLTQLEAEYSVDTENNFKLDFSFTSHGKGSHSHF